VNFDTWIDKAWIDHGDDAAGVAARLAAEGPALTRNSDDVSALGRLAHHVYGEHLARYDEGRAFLVELAARPAAAGATANLRTFDASLALCAGAADLRGTLDVPTRVRVTALAAGNLTERDPARASLLLREAVAAAEAATLDDKDPACRALAVTGNNIACTIESKEGRTSDERALMILAARTAREYWARSGTWLETERAEYRLARTWLAAGDVAQARQHAQACLAIVREHDSPALEAFFGWEALGLVERAAGNATAHTHALTQAREAYGRLREEDRGWCKASLDALAA
jgi:hypothetical protein